MTTIRELCDNDPAVAIEHLIDGLLNHGEIKDFKLDFDHLSKWTNVTYSGGAASVTLIRILDLSFAPLEMSNNFARADLMQTERRDLLAFEESIELFTQGNLAAIEKYFGLSSSGISGLPWNLQNHSWQGDMPQVINFWQQLTTGKRLTKNIDERWVHAASAALLPTEKIRCNLA